ncbi:AAA family ATPase [Actinokineospora guangxiensis]|uniref:AAA family ATPase n=1 Tax=Actinokineospora guangxiensis TaxID=1490288 RepID=A0ABW0ET90_9PSEU
MGASTGRGLRKASPYGIYAFLTAAAVAPLAGPALGAAGEFEIALNQLGGMGTNHLATVMANVAGDVRAKGGQVGDEQWRELLAEALAQRLDGEPDSGKHAELVAEVRAVLRAVDAVECALAESAEHAAGLHLELLTAAAALHEEFGDVRWALAEVRDLVERSHDAIADVQRELVDRRARERADGRFTQRVLVGLARMRRALRQTGSPAAGGPCPYPGLAGFQAEDAPWFFGREEAVDDLVAAIAERQRDGTPLLVVGASGVGKSSLLRAGLLPALAEDAVPGSAAWPVVVFTPGADPLAELAARTAAVARVAAVGVAERLRADPGSYGAFARQAALRGSWDSRLVIVVDQVEELFTQCAEPAVREAFVAALASARTAAVVVLAVRGDFFDRCAEFTELADAVAAPRVLGPMTEADLRRVITEPAERVGAPVEAGLPARLLADLGARADGGALPLLAHALRATWDSGGLTLAAYQATGGIGSAVAASAEALYADAGPDGRRLLESTLPHMVTIVDDRGVARRRVYRGALPDAVLAPWVAARLLTVDGDSVQFSHEALLSAWPRLAAWIERDRDRLAARQRLEDAARDWAAHGRPTDLLLRGERLDEARALVAEGESAEHERDFVAAGTRAKRVRSLVSGGLITGLVLVTVIAVIASLLATSAQTKAEREETLSRSRQLAAESLTMASGDVRGAMTTAARAWDMARTPQAHGALVSASMLTTRTTLPVSDGIVSAIDTDPSGTLAAVSPEEGRVELVDIDTGERRALTGLSSGVGDLRFSPDGTLVAAGAFQRDGLRVWRVSDGAPVATVMATAHADWRPDGKALASIDIETGAFQIGVWDAASGELITRFGSSTTLISDVRFDGSGERIAASYADGAVRVWDVAEGRLVATVVEPHDGGDMITIAAAGELLAVAANGSAEITLWNTATGRSRGVLDVSPDEAGLIALIRGGGELVFSSGATVTRWDTGTRTLTARNAALPQGILALAVSADAGTVVVGSVDGTITRMRRSGTWYTARHAAAIGVDADPKRGAVTATYADGSWHTFTRGSQFPEKRRKTRSPAPEVAYGPDGRLFFLGSDGVLEHDGRRSEGNEFLGQGSELAMSADGSLVAAALNTAPSMGGPNVRHEIRVWSTDDLSVRARINVSGASSLVFTGSTLRAAAPGGLLLGWDTATFAEVRTLRLPGDVYAMAPTPDGGRIVVATTTLHVIDLATGSVVRGDFGAHPSAVRSLAVSPDGLIATATTEDSIVRLWRLDSGDEVVQYIGHAAGSLNQVRFVDGGKTVLSAGTDGDIGFWPVDPEVALRTICATLASERPPGC